jgi:hypothetical protein
MVKVKKEPEQESMKEFTKEDAILAFKGIVDVFKSTDEHTL